MRLECRVEVLRSIPEVFAFISSPENLPLWISGVSGAKRTYSGPMGLGATFETTHAPGGRTRKGPDERAMVMVEVKGGKWTLAP